MKFKIHKFVMDSLCPFNPSNNGTYIKFYLIISRCNFVSNCFYNSTIVDVRQNMIQNTFYFLKIVIFKLKNFNYIWSYKFKSTNVFNMISMTIIAKDQWIHTLKKNIGTNLNIKIIKYVNLLIFYMAKINNGFLVKTLLQSYINFSSYNI